MSEAHNKKQNHLGTRIIFGTTTRQFAVESFLRDPDNRNDDDGDGVGRGDGGHRERGEGGQLGIGVGMLGCV